MISDGNVHCQSDTDAKYREDVCLVSPLGRNLTSVARSLQAKHVILSMPGMLFVCGCWHFTTQVLIVGQRYIVYDTRSKRTNTHTCTRVCMHPCWRRIKRLHQHLIIYYLFVHAPFACYCIIYYLLSICVRTLCWHRNKRLHQASMAHLLSQHMGLLSALYKLFKANDRTKYFRVEHWGSFLEQNKLLNNQTGEIERGEAERVLAPCNSLNRTRRACDVF